MKQLSGYIILVLVLLLAVGCGQEAAPSFVGETAVSPINTPPAPTNTPAPSPIPEPTAFPLTAVANPNWWDNTTFYEIFVRSFADSDGDGVGDLNGLIANLDYLNDGDPATQDDLGITGIWLMPIMQSPSYHGYDTVDYYQVDDEYGSNEDFKRLVEEANARGIRVIIDLVMNHSSDQHPWFLEAKKRDSARRDWYVWSNVASGNNWYNGGDGYYYGYFWSGMPDLNYENPEVTAAMQDIIRFWLEDMGADGFRLDAIKHLIEDGNILENTPDTHTWLQEEFYPAVKSVNPEAFTVGEVWSTSDDVVAYIGDEVDVAFEFIFADALLQSAQSGQKVHIERAQPIVVDTYPAGQYATFLANHDQTRARSRLLNDEQTKVAATMQLLSPGIPFIYYGEEIGMQGDKPDENIRRPMQWNESGGFSAGEPWHAYFEDYQERHVTGQNDDPNSILNHYRALIQLRNEHSALRSGGWLMVETDQKSIYAFLRYDDEESILILVNLGRKPADTYNLTLPASLLTSGVSPTILMGDGEIQSPDLNESGGFDNYQPLPVLPPHGSVAIHFQN